MIEASLLLTGILIGIAVAAPIGPINLMAIQRGLAHGFRAGLLTGVGAVLGDGVFAVVSALGLTAVSGFLKNWAGPVEAVGGVMLVLLGIRAWFTATPARSRVKPSGWVHHGGLVGGTFLLTISNPATMLGFLAIFGAGGLLRLPGSYVHVALLVGAVMLGSLLWWLFLAALVGTLRERFTDRTLLRINRFSAMLIFGFGLIVLVRLALRQGLMVS